MPVDFFVEVNLWPIIRIFRDRVQKWKHLPLTLLGRVTIYPKKTNKHFNILIHYWTLFCGAPRLPEFPCTLYNYRLIEADWHYQISAFTILHPNWYILTGRCFHKWIMLQWRQRLHLRMKPYWTFSLEGRSLRWGAEKWPISYELTFGNLQATVAAISTNWLFVVLTPTGVVEMSGM